MPRRVAVDKERANAPTRRRHRQDAKTTGGQQPGPLPSQRLEPAATGRRITTTVKHVSSPDAPGRSSTPTRPAAAEGHRNLGMAQKSLAPMESQSYLLGSQARGPSDGPSSSASRRRAWLVAPMTV